MPTTVHYLSSVVWHEESILNHEILSPDQVSAPGNRLYVIQQDVCSKMGILRSQSSTDQGPSNEDDNIAYTSQDTARSTCFGLSRSKIVPKFLLEGSHSLKFPARSKNVYGSKLVKV